MSSNVDGRAMLLLRSARSCLTRQQFNTLKGQVLAGHGEAAMRGLDKILSRQQKGCEA